MFYFLQIEVNFASLFYFAPTFLPHFLRIDIFVIVEIKNGVVFVKGYFSGTKVVGGDWERYMTMPQGGHTIANLVDKIEKDGQLAKIFRKGWIECHLNPEQTGIVRWVKHTYVFDVKPQSMSIW